MTFEGGDDNNFEGGGGLNPNSRDQRATSHLQDVHVPEPLRDLSAWLCWQYEQFTGEVKPRKIPYWADGTRRHGTQGSPADRDRLTTFAAARDAAARGSFDGVGFAPLPECGYTFLDFDNCVDAKGHLPEDVEAIVGRTYAEYSPSGTGVRAVLKGNLGNRKSATTEDQYGFETFSSNGFVTLTGNILPGCDILGYEDKIADVDEGTRQFAERRFGATTSTFDPDDFMAGHEPRSGLSIEKMQELLSYLDPGMGRDQWLRVGMALHHETDGDDTGFELWDEWSQGGHNYPSTEALRYQWDSFKPKPGKRLITMPSVIRMAKEAGYSAAEGAASLSSNAPQMIAAHPYQWRRADQIPRRDWLFGRWLLKGTVACVIAPGGIGKSTFVSAMALSCATGQNFLGKEVWGGPKKIWL